MNALETFLSIHPLKFNCDDVFTSILFTQLRQTYTEDELGKLYKDHWIALGFEYKKELKDEA